MKKRFLVFGLLMGVFHFPAFADDGNDLLLQCNQFLSAIDNPSYNPGMNGALSSGQCVGYVQAMRDVMEMQQRVCIPGAVKTGQLVRLIVKTGRDNPSGLNLPAAALVAGTLAMNYPCDKAKK